MKIFIVGPAHPYRGGIADTNESLARALQKQNHSVKIITFSLQYPNFLFPGKTQYSTDPPPSELRIHRWINSMNPLSWYSTARKINKEKPDLVIVRYWIPFLGMCFGSINNLLNKKIKTIGFCDNILPHESRIGDKILSAYFIRSCDAFLTMSNKVREELHSFTHKKCLTIPHPINDNLGKRIDKSAALVKLKLSKEVNYLLFFGLVRKYKGLDLILQAMARKNPKLKKVHLIVAGEFYDDKEEYLDFIRSNQLEDQVHIFDHFIPTEDIKIFFSACDLVTQTYHSASQSGVSQLAFNFNTPILVTNVGGLSETVIDRKHGYVVEKDPKSIEKAIVDFFDQDRFNEFSNNIGKIKDQYSWENFSEQLVLFYKQI